MPSNSIKSRIIARLMELLQPLQTEGKFRKVQRVKTLWLIEPMTPALHLVVGDESVVGLDNRGFVMQFPVAFKAILSDARGTYTLADEMAAYLQQALETDPQLEGLVTKIDYQGELPFSTEETKPAGGTTLMYEIEYRRVRGSPDVTY